MVIAEVVASVISSLRCTVDGSAGISETVPTKRHGSWQLASQLIYRNALADIGRSPAQCVYNAPSIRGNEIMKSAVARLQAVGMFQASSLILENT